jgi:hypothetical protein
MSEVPLQDLRVVRVLHSEYRYRGLSLIINSAPIGSYSSLTPRDQW